MIPRNQLITCIGLHFSGINAAHINTCRISRNLVMIELDLCASWIDLSRGGCRLNKYLIEVLNMEFMQLFKAVKEARPLGGSWGNQEESQVGANGTSLTQAGMTLLQGTKLQSCDYSMHLCHMHGRLPCSVHNQISSFMPHLSYAKTATMGSPAGQLPQCWKTVP